MKEVIKEDKVSVISSGADDSYKPFSVVNNTLDIDVVKAFCEAVKMFSNNDLLHYYRNNKIIKTTDPESVSLDQRYILSWVRKHPGITTTELCVKHVLLPYATGLQENDLIILIQAKMEYVIGLISNLISRKLIFGVIGEQEGI